MTLEDILSQRGGKNYVEKVVQFIGPDPEKVEELVRLILEGEERQVFHGAWVLRYVAEANPELIEPYLPSLIEALKKPNPDFLPRSVLKILEDLPLPKESLGDLTQICFQYLEAPQTAVAIRVFAMTVLYRISELEPDLKFELKAILEMQAPYGSAGFKSRAKKILKKLG